MQNSFPCTDICKCKTCENTELEEDDNYTDVNGYETEDDDDDGVDP